MVAERGTAVERDAAQHARVGQQLHFARGGGERREEEERRVLFCRPMPREATLYFRVCA